MHFRNGVLTPIEIDLFILVHLFGYIPPKSSFDDAFNESRIVPPTYIHFVFLELSLGVFVWGQT